MVGHYAMPAVYPVETRVAGAPESLARQYYQLFNERRLDEAGLLVDRQASFHYLPTRQRLIGRAGYRALVAGWLNAFEDAWLDVTAVHILEDHACDVEFIGSGTHTGDLVLGEWITIPATGRAADLPFRDRLRFHNGLLVSSELAFDLAEMRRRLLGF